jgi:ABC transport system ATP-binding/permease protein
MQAQSKPPELARLQIQSAQGTRTFVMIKSEVTLGRATDNDVVLQDPMASSHHARLLHAPDGLRIVDLNSTNGTFLNGQRLPPQSPRAFGPTDLLLLGQSRITVTMPSLQQPAVPRQPDLGRTDVALGVAPPAQPRKTPQPVPANAYGAQRAHTVLQIRLANGEQAEAPLHKAETRLGRAEDNDVILQSSMVSGHHLTFSVAASGQLLVMDLGSLNGTRLNGQPLSPRRAEAVRPGDLVQLQEFSFAIRPATAQSPAPSVVASQIRVSPNPPLVLRPAGPGVPIAGDRAAGGGPSATRMLSMDAEESITVGRAPDNTITFDHPLISRYHAMIERLGTRRRIKDLKSTNGVFVNGQRIDGEAWLSDGDEVHIGPLKLRLAAGQVHQLADEGVRLDVVRINKWVTKELNLLRDLSLSIQPLEFVALVGLSGAGKSTLMDAINGFRPGTHGTVYANGTNLYENFDMFRNDMGYVPQKDIVHMELTVYKALDYAAQLRMPADVTSEERHQRILEVLADLDLTERKDLPIHKLSGGQLKRVSIGVELLTKPRLFFLDEPTSGLDPGTEYNMMRLLRKLADQGRTIMLITHATKNVMMCDKVIILVRGGRLAFYGPPEEALVYFDTHRTEYERRIKDMEFDDIYTILEDEARGEPQAWHERYQQSSAYQKYVVDRLQAAQVELGKGTPVAARQRPVKRISALQQFLILSARNLNIMFQDKASLALMLALSPVIGLADFMWGRQLFSPVQGDAFNIVTMLFMMGLISILVGAMASVREIVKEVDIYKRERAIALRIAPYIFSKLWIGLVLALYQAIVFLLTKWIFVGFAPPTLSFGAWIGVFITLFMGSLSGYLMGLAISAGSPNQMVALLLVILVLVPQFLFAGALMPLDLIPGGHVISVVASTRWAFGAFVRLSGAGEQLVDDACWPFERSIDGPERGWNEWLQVDNDGKAVSCACMGPNMFSRCDDFPGMLNPEFFGFDKPEGRTFAGTKHKSNDALETAMISAMRGSPTWSVLLANSTSPGMPLLDHCFDDDSAGSNQECRIPAKPVLSQRAALGFDPNQPCSQQNPQTTIQQCETFRQALVGYEEGLNECEAGIQNMWVGLRDACNGVNTSIASGNRTEICMEEWKADMEIWETDMETYQTSQGDRQRAISGAEGMLKSYWEKFNFIYGTGVGASWFYMGIIDVVLLVAILYFQKRKDVV